MAVRLDKPTSAFRAVVVVCVFLIAFAGFVTAVHFHPNGSKIPESACSTCALVHSGVVPVQYGPPVPVFVATQVVEESAPQLHSFALVSFLYIRPPPTV